MIYRASAIVFAEWTDDTGVDRCAWVNRGPWGIMGPSMRAVRASVISFLQRDSAVEEIVSVSVRRADQ